MAGERQWGTYDLIVVVGRTAAILRIQLLGLLVLVPALWAGASFGGVVGVATAQAAVAFCVVLPLYLWNLRGLGLGITAGALARRLWLPAAVSLVMAAGCWLLVQRIGSPLLAVLATGAVAVLAITALLWARRGELASLRGVARIESLEAAA